MKNIYNIILIVVSLVFLWSCQEDEKIVMQQPESFVLNTPKYATGIYDLQNMETIEFTTSQPDYGFTGNPTYSVEISLTPDFSSFVTLPSRSTIAKFHVDAAEVALALVGMHGVTEENEYPTDPHTLYVRLSSVLNEKGDGMVKSNIIELQVKGYFALDPVVLPETMYLIGNVAGNWNWDNATEMIPIHGTEGKFWAMQYLGQTEDGVNAQIKFNTERAWDDNEFGFNEVTLNENGTADAGTAENDGNIEIGNPGWYIVVVTTTINGRDYAYAVDFFPPHVYLQGGVAGGNWGTTDEAYRFSIPDISLGANAEFVSPAFTGAGVPDDGGTRASIVLEGHDWWQTEFMVFDGIFIPRGAGDDQDRVAGSVGQRLYINFTERTGRIE